MMPLHLNQKHDDAADDDVDDDDDKVDDDNVDNEDDPSIFFLTFIKYIWVTSQENNADRPVHLYSL